jgi:hypothetical protein
MHKHSLQLYPLGRESEIRRSERIDLAGSAADRAKQADHRRRAPHLAVRPRSANEHWDEESAGPAHHETTWEPKEGWERNSLTGAANILIDYKPVVAIRPVGSTNQRSLLNALPLSRDTSQSAISVGGNGPRLAAGTLPTECRLSA